jgi:hypothetical protein
MSESDLSVQVQVGKQFDSLATFKLAVTRWAVNGGHEIKISKTDKTKRELCMCASMRNAQSMHLLGGGQTLKGVLPLRSVLSARDDLILQPLGCGSQH